MTRDLIVAQTLSHGLQPTYTEIDPDNDARVAYDATAFAHLRNTSESSVTLTIRTNVTLDGDLSLPDRALVVDAGEAMFTKAFAKSVYRQSDNYVYFDTTAAGLEIAVLKP